MLTKNAIGNLLNKYSAILRKCRLLNACALSLGLAIGAVGFVPDNALGADLTDAVQNPDSTSYQMTEDHNGNIGGTTSDHLLDTGIKSSFEITGDPSGFHTITDNSAKNVPYKCVVVLQNNEKLTFSNITIEDFNISREVGIALTSNAIVKNEGGELIFNNCTIQNNRTNHSVVANSETESFMTIDNSKFQNNINYYNASGNGIVVLGTIHNESTISSITKSDFSNNIVYVRTTNDKNASYGAAITNYSKIGIISESNFKANTAMYGGALYNIKNGEITSISNSTFKDNGQSSISYTIKEWEAYNNGDSSRLVTNNFTGNKSQWGGAILNRGKIGDLEYVDFEGNSAVFGGSIYNDSSSIINSIASCTFTGKTTNNTIESVGSNGGAIYNHDATIGSISGTTFDSLSVTNNGGAINNSSGDKAAYSTIIEKITDSKFTNNLSAYGGAIFNERSNATEGIEGTIILINGIEFLKNTAEKSGGAIHNGKNALITTIDNCTFNSNKTTVSNVNGGGAIFNNASIDTISESTFTLNTTNYLGGALSNYGSINNILGGKFLENSTYAYGGAISNGSKITSINNVTFDNNTALYGGGAISNYNLSSDTTLYPCIELITNSTFNANKATDTTYGLGGAIINAGTIKNIQASHP